MSTQENIAALARGSGHGGASGPSGASGSAGGDAQPDAGGLTPRSPTTVNTTVNTLIRGHRRELAVALLLGVVASACAIGLAATSGWLISKAALRPPILSLEVAIAAVQAFGLGRAAARYAERLASHDAALRVLAALRVRLYQGLERVAPAGLPERERGDLLARLVADVDALQDLLLRILLPAAVAVTVSGASVAFIAAVLPAAGALLACGVLIVAVAAPGLSHLIARRAERRLLTDRGRLASAVVDLYEGMPELVVNGAAQRRLTAIAELEDRLVRAERRSARAVGAGSALTVLGGGLTVLAMALLGLDAVRAGRLDGVMLAVLVLTPLALFEALSPLPEAARAVPRVRAAARRVFEIVDAPDPTPAPNTPVDVHWGPDSRLTVHDASFAWPGAEPVVEHVDLTLGAGRRLALTGPSGAGKSTVISGLLRFLDPVSGSVRIDGVDLRHLDPARLRSLIGWCGQDAQLFDTTLRENLLVGDPAADDAKLWSVLRTVRLDGWAASLPQGLDTPVGVLGDAVSGGERQRIALARTLLADTPIIVLDEPTAHLDAATADEVSADLLRATAGRTVLWSTHRPEVLCAVDGAVELATRSTSAPRATPR
ncbi:thiol reductant ABC exporter subunit CydC [Catenulispora subtropica]|uniref:ABC transporter, CydDC cysteine exporter (CydDC-E) family, permease/ATP-binding protein CydC n=1 Tax=Catenulispora subtropica TaxID=450798 RepID=A0ABN2TEI7_9ACTN